MTDRNVFDPVRLAARCRAGLYMTIGDPPADLDASGRGRIAAVAVNTIVSTLLVGEGKRFTTTLDRAAGWLAEADARLGDDDDEGWFGVRRRRRALATARWLRGEDAGPALQGAALAGAALLTEEPPQGLHELADHLCDLMLAGYAAAVKTVAACFPPAADDIEAATALQFATALVAGRPSDDVELLPAIGRVFTARLDDWLANGAFLRIATWYRLAFIATGLASDASGALLMSYAFMPGVALPSALADRGWRAETDTAVVTLPGAMLDRVEGLAVISGLHRDTDGVPQDRDRPRFASWSGQGSDRREIDWHREDTAYWLEFRGKGAGVLAGALAAALGGEVTPMPLAAFAKVITGPRRSGSAALSPLGTLRWRMLRASLAALVPENHAIVTALIAAGLIDGDWRVRMTAVIAVGRLVLPDLAAAALAAAVPEAGADGLVQEDRRMLLALRHAAHDLASGARHEETADLLEITARRQAHQARLQARIAHLPDQPEDRADALLLGLWYGRSGPGARIPGQWRHWLKD